ncbi:hypothetical protein CCR95_21935 [Thiocystis minor]|nr:hypothetical protein [Thiocystis minor]
MLKERWTFNETLERLTLMPQMRIRKAKRDLWSQLDQVFFPLPQTPSVSTPAPTPSAINAAAIAD